MMLKKSTFKKYNKVCLTKLVKYMFYSMTFDGYEIY